MAAVALETTASVRGKGGTIPTRASVVKVVRALTVGRTTSPNLPPAQACLLLSRLSRRSCNLLPRLRLQFLWHPNLHRPAAPLPSLLLPPRTYSSTKTRSCSHSLHSNNLFLPPYPPPMSPRRQWASLSPLRSHPARQRLQRRPPGVQMQVGNGNSLTKHPTVVCGRSSLSRCLLCHLRPHRPIISTLPLRPSYPPVLQARLGSSR